ncbi:GDSL esterase/lipase 7-like [Mangifera indica]|uniref:GDSL esterase/lipase 7-like n=1 Tax=Mangifera indica TaxID=29780 RepID=UPI001CF9B3BA|nr:GDSL esterase/lipase 7-like [Mangifera indica]
MASFTFLFIFFQCLFFLIISITAAAQKPPLAPALYVFGDSLLDSGNNNFLPTIAKVNYLPYGANFPQGPTGRFTNGKTVADFIAEFLGLPYSPPYLGSKNSVPVTGLNYASGACGILPKTGRQIGKCLNLGEQIDLFAKTVQSMLSIHFNNDLGKLSGYLSKSIAIISIGNNDYFSDYFDTNSSDTSRRLGPEPYAQLLLDNLSRLLQKLYNIGARKIIMFDIGPLGCTPYITRKYEHNGQCDEDKNQIVQYFNNRLASMLTDLTTTLKGSNFVLGHSHRLGYDAAINPSRYGLRDTRNPCCTTWSNGTSVCIPLSKPCPNANEYYFWDGYHLTEALYSLIASSCIDDKSFCVPLNLKDLVNI